jgi:Gpi18-like mannosyltransferase
MLSIKEINLSKACRYLIKGGVILLIMTSPFVFHLLFSYNNICIENTDPPSICAKPLPNIYSYIQQKYWNVGLLHYFTLSNWIFIAIGTPAIILSLYGAATLYRPAWCVQAKGLYLSFLILLVMTVCFTNVQSSTRFFSTHPVFYYILAVLWQWRGVRVWIIFYCLGGMFLFTVGFPWT